MVVENSSYDSLASQLSQFVVKGDLAIVQYSKKLEIWFNLITFFNLYRQHPYFFEIFK